MAVESGWDSSREAYRSGVSIPPLSEKNHSSGAAIAQGHKVEVNVTSWDANVLPVYQRMLENKGIQVTYPRIRL